MPHPKVITPEAAIAAGITPAVLRQAAAWNAAEAEVLRRKDPQGAARREAQAAALYKVVGQVERLTAAASQRRAA